MQIIGTKKCSDTKKALRFFKERSIPHHFLDLSEKSLSKGELENISRSIPLGELIDIESKEYQKKGFAYMEIDLFEELLANNVLLKTPVVRNGSKATVGDAPAAWKAWLADA
ncbi:MAG: hypothetical protein JW904_00205 [Spirochaetales bacterium]|nr:hypothetical protein [Spirochaetales bacterium]